MHNDGLFEGIFETALDAIITIDDAGTIESFNPAAERLFGYLPAEVVGRNVRVLMPPPFEAEHDGYLAAYQRSGVRKIIGRGREVVARRKDGVRVPIHLSVSEATIEGRRTFIGFARDISELNTARADADQARRRAAAILDTAVDGIITIDAGGTILSFNAGAEALFGHSASEVIGRNVSLLTPEPIRSEHDGYIERFLRTGERRIIGIGREISALRRDGRQFPAILSISHFQIGGEQFFTGIIRDITALKQREAQLDAVNRELMTRTSISERQLELSRHGREQDHEVGLCEALLTCLVRQLSAISGAFHLALADGRSAGGLRLVAGHALPAGRRPDGITAPGVGLVGQAARDQDLRFIPCGADDYAIETSFGAVSPRCLVIVPVTRSAGLVGVIELALGSVPAEVDRDYLASIGEVLGIIVGRARDQARIRELLVESQSREEELRTANEQLDQRARELETQQRELAASNVKLEEQRARLHELNQDLELSRREIEGKARELEASSRYKSQFLANMSHELRTPLNSIMVLSRVLEENASANLDHDQIESARMIATSGADLLRLINDILDLSRIEAGKMELTPTTFAVADLLRDIERTMRPLMAVKDLRFEVEVAAGAPARLHTDRRRLEQILRNLLSNAHKFTPAGSVTLKIESVASRPTSPSPAATSAGPCMLAFRVRDTGIGIRAEDQAVVFQAFKQVDGTSSRRYGGTGLGLAISMDLAHALGGQVELVSEFGKGSEFSLLLPIPADVPAASAAAWGRSTPASDRSPSTEPADDRLRIGAADRVVLFIEDDTTLCASLVRQGRSLGFRCLVAHDGESGLVLAREHRPHSIVLDRRLPGIAGDEVLRRLKADPVTREIPVHVMSGDADAARLRDDGAVSFLRKPVGADQLRDLLGIAGQQTGAGQPLRVLIVEDYEAERVALRRLLEPFGAMIHMAASSDDALALVAQHRFACVILDLLLLRGSGREFLERYQAVTGPDRPPVIIYTSTDVSLEERRELLRHTTAIIHKGVGADRRLLDEVGLFLRGVADATGTKQPTDERGSYLQGKTVLLVDDDVRNIFALRQMLLSRGLQVLTAETGREALEQIARHADIAVVLMDIMMPEMDGIEATRRLRADARYEDLPVIAVTAKAMVGDRERCMNAGMNDYLAKPVDAEELLGLLHVWAR